MIKAGDIVRLGSGRTRYAGVYAAEAGFYILYPDVPYFVIDPDYHVSASSVVLQSKNARHNMLIMDVEGLLIKTASGIFEKY